MRELDYGSTFEEERLVYVCVCVCLCLCVACTGVGLCAEYECNEGPWCVSFFIRECSDETDICQSHVSPLLGAMVERDAVKNRND